MRCLISKKFLKVAIISRIHESCHTYAWVQKPKSRDYTMRCLISEIFHRVSFHVVSVISRIHKSCHTYAWVVSHINVSYLHCEFAGTALAPCWCRGYVCVTRLVYSEGLGTWILPAYIWQAIRICDLIYTQSNVNSSTLHRTKTHIFCQPTCGRTLERPFVFMWSDMCTIHRALLWLFYGVTSSATTVWGGSD